MLHRVLLIAICHCIGGRVVLFCGDALIGWEIYSQDGLIVVGVDGDAVD